MPNTIPFSRKPIALAISALCVSMPFYSFAQESQETVQVWGTEISNESSLIESDIDLKQADHLSDLLRDQPGIDIGGSHSTVQGINIRGVDELDLNITIDGVSQNNNMFHHSGNLLINADILKAVDIKVGTNSVLTGGLAGGVAFESKDAKELLQPGEKFGTRLHTSFGSNDYLSSSATLYSQLTEELDAMAYVTLTDKNNPSDGDGGEIAGNAGEINNAMAKIGWDINDHNRLELTYDKYRDQGDYYLRANFGSGYNVNNNQATQETEYTRETLSLNYQLDKGDDIQLRAALYQNEINYAPSETEGNSTHRGFSALAQSTLQAHTVRYGFEGNEQVSKQIISGRTNNEESADLFAIYVEDEIALGEKFSVTPGVRYNYYAVKMHSPASGDRLDKTFTDFTFALASQYKLTDQWTLRASSTQLFKGPGLRETYTAYNTEFDQNVKAETGLNTEVGIAFEEQNIIGLDHFAFSVNAFKTEIDDYIDNWSAGKGRGTPGLYTNQGDYTITGFESTLAASKGALDARFTYAHSDSDNNESDSALRYEVGDSLSLALAYDLPNWDLALNWNTLIALELEPDTQGDTKKEGYTVHSASLRWMPMAVDNLTLTAGLENIFNEQYYSHASYTSASGSIKDYEPGRNVKLSASYQF